MNKRIRTWLILALTLALTTGFMAVAEAGTAARLTMSRRTLTMDWGARYTLSVTVTPSNASDRGLISWTSDNPLVKVTPDASTRKATVRVDPKPHDAPDAIAATITAATSMGKTASCVVTVKRLGVKSIRVSPSRKTVCFSSSQSPVQLSAVCYFSGSPASSDQLACAWTTSDSKVATVDGSGLVTFTGEGAARITATYAPGISDGCSFTVRPVRVRSVALDRSMQYLDPGESFKLNADVKSAVNGYRPSYGDVAWRSDNEAVAVVDEKGVVTARHSGIATITASADIGGYAKSASCVVYVRDDDPVAVTITAAGDCVLGGDPRTTGITARSTQREYEELVRKSGNPQYPFEKVRALFADRGATGHKNLSVVNVEVCLTSSGGSNPSTLRKFLFRGSPRNAQALAAGIDIANIANNHTADMGPNAYGHTAKNIAAYGGGAAASGYNRYNTRALPAVTVMEVEGKRIGFYGVQANQVPVSVLTSRIQKYKKDYDLDMLVVSIHWTGQPEYVRPVTAAMKAYARGAIGAGADLVIGHHRHEISGIEKYRGKYILYDLGNFVTGGGGGQWTYAVQIDFKISSSFTETASEGGADQIRIYPVCTTSDARFAWNAKKQDYTIKLSNNWQPTPAEEAIHHFDKDSGEPVPDDSIADDVIRIINANSPAGADGGRFRADGYVKPYSSLR